MEAKDIVVALRSRGMTQTQIADATGIPQPTISKIERGEVMDVMSKSYRALLQALKKAPKKAPPASAQPPSAQQGA